MIIFEVHCPLVLAYEETCKRLGVVVIKCRFKRRIFEGFVLFKGQAG